MTLDIKIYQLNEKESDLKKILSSCIVGELRG